MKGKPFKDAEWLPLSALGLTAAAKKRVKEVMRQETDPGDHLRMLDDCIDSYYSMLEWWSNSCHVDTILVAALCIFNMDDGRLSRTTSELGKSLVAALRSLEGHHEQVLRFVGLRVSLSEKLVIQLR